MTRNIISKGARNRNEGWALSLWHRPFNPAVAIGVTVMHLVKGSNLWIHLIADLAGGAVAATAFKELSTEDRAA